MRYVGQEHAVTVDLPLDLFKSQDRDGIKKPFDAVHQTRYGFSVAERKGRDRQPAGAMIGEMRKPAFEHDRQGGAGAGRGAFRGKRPVYFAPTGIVETPTYDRAGAQGRQPDRQVRR